jgi:hypothetical protein
VLLPGFLKRHSLTVQPYLGPGAYGPQYGPAFTVKGFRDDARRLVRAPSGDEVISETTFYCDLGVTIPPESLVLVGSRSTTVITVKTRDPGGLPAPQHLEVILK